MFPFLIGRIRTESLRIIRNKQIEQRFPFLIGRIRTEIKELDEVEKKMFPFLIGRIRTKKQVLLLAHSDSFPFLIGRIRTWLGGSALPVTEEGFHSS